MALVQENTSLNSNAVLNPMSSSFRRGAEMTGNNVERKLFLVVFQVWANCYDSSKFIDGHQNVSNKGICYSNRINKIICKYMEFLCFKKLTKGCDVGRDVM